MPAAISRRIETRPLKDKYHANEEKNCGADGNALCLVEAGKKCERSQDPRRAQQLGAGVSSNAAGPLKTRRQRNQVFREERMHENPKGQGGCFSHSAGTQCNLLPACIGM